MCMHVCNTPEFAFCSSSLSNMADKERIVARELRIFLPANNVKANIMTIPSILSHNKIHIILLHSLKLQQKPKQGKRWRLASRGQTHLFIRPSLTVTCRKVNSQSMNAEVFVLSLFICIHRKKWEWLARQSIYRLYCTHLHPPPRTPPPCTPPPPPPP